MIKINRKNAGFSLIELLFAMLFLSIIVFGVIKLQTSNLTLSNTKKLDLKANSYTAQGLEILDALGAGAITGCVSDCYLSDSGGYSVDSGDTEKLDNDMFERFFEHSEADLLGDATLATMKVSWTDSSGPHTVSAQRIILPLP